MRRSPAQRWWIGGAAAVLWTLGGCFNFNDDMAKCFDEGRCLPDDAGDAAIPDPDAGQPDSGQPDGGDAGLGVCTLGSGNAGWVAVYTAPGNVALYGVWGSSRSDVWAVGAASDGGAVGFRYDGGSWAQVALPPVPELRAVTGTGPDDVWAFGFDGGAIHWDGGAWGTVSTAGTSTNLRGALAISPSSVLVVGDDGTFLHGDVGGLAPESPGILRDLRTIWSLDGGYPLRGSGYSILMSRASFAAGWQVDRTEPNLDGGTLSSVVWYGIAGVSHDDLWFAGEDRTGPSERPTFIRWNGAFGERITCELLGTAGAQALWAVAPNDFWAGGDGTVIHGDGQNWTTYPSPSSSTIRGMWGSAPDDIWAVTNSGRILHKGP